MTNVRKGESKPLPRFRKSRFFISLDQWYFITRERTIEGPFKHQIDAQNMLETYLNGLDETVH